MISLGRATAAFFLMMTAGYLVVVALCPAPSATGWRPADMGGPSAAARLSQEAQALVAHKPAADLQ